MSCEQCERQKQISLIDGKQACTWCEAHRMECEARWILKTFPAHRRSKAKPQTVRDWLEGLEAVRGKNHVQRLREVMRAMWKGSQSQQGPR